MAWPKVAELVRSSRARRDRRFGPANRPRPRVGRHLGLACPATARRALHPRHSHPQRLSAEPAPRVHRLGEQAKELLEILEPGDHLVGHSYGGVISLLAAAEAAPSSLAVLEPPAFGVAQGDPAVDSLIEELAPLWPSDLEPEEFLRRFIETVDAFGSYSAPSPLPPDMEASVRALMVERAPWEAEIPLDELAAAPFPKLVVSGGHNPAFDAVCDVLEERLGAERAVLPGAGHSIPRAPGFNERLLDFLAY